MARETKIYYLLSILKEKFKLENPNALTRSVLIEKAYTDENDRNWRDRIKKMDAVGILDELRVYATDKK